MRSWVRISHGAAERGIIFLKAGRIFSPVWCYAPFSPGSRPGTKGPSFSPGCSLPGGEPGLEGGSPPGVKPVPPLVVGLPSVKKNTRQRS